MTIQNREAYKLGVEAFEEDRMAVPAQDPAVCEMIKGKPMGKVIEILDSWSKGWHTANLAAAVGPAR